MLPFQYLGGDPEADFFLDSVAEDLITASVGLSTVLALLTVSLVLAATVFL